MRLVILLTIGSSLAFAGCNDTNRNDRATNENSTTSTEKGVVGPTNVDDDGDTFTEDAGDCNDGNVKVYPGSVRVDRVAYDSLQDALDVTTATEIQICGTFDDGPYVASGEYTIVRDGSAGSAQIVNLIVRDGAELITNNVNLDTLMVSEGSDVEAKNGTVSGDVVVSGNEAGAQRGSFVARKVVLSGQVVVAGYLQLIGSDVSGSEGITLLSAEHVYFENTTVGEALLRFANGYEAGLSEITGSTGKATGSCQQEYVGGGCVK